jgi:class 3 adenylate cyclase
MPPETRYAKGSDGLIAYQVVGDGPRDLVYLTGATSHVDVRWESSRFTRFSERLASFCRLIMFDRRGIGGSDPVPIDAPPTWEEWAEDLTVVMDAAGSERAAVFGMLDASAMAIPFAAIHPERTTALLLGNTTAKWVAADDYPEGLNQQVAFGILDLIENGWGTEEFAILTSPSVANDPKERALFARFMRTSASPRAAGAQFRLQLGLDLRGILGSILVPTLVLHRRDFQLIPVEQGRYLADHIPGAKFVELEGADSSLAFGDSDSALDAIEEFLTGVRRRPDPDRVLATVLLTDLVDSTRRASELGDRKWRELLNRHDELVRSQIEGYRGSVKKMTGDGVLATFDAPGTAIRCALSLDEAVNGLGLRMRAGVHTGEVELRGDDVGGIAVNIAARVSALAGVGEVLVSRTVTDLVAGSGIRFRERGAHVLKGVPGEWHLYSVEA